MKNISFMLASVACVAATPILAQSTAEETAEAAADAVAEAAEQAAAEAASEAVAESAGDAVEGAGDAPPPIMIPQSSPTYPPSFPREPRLQTPRRDLFTPADYPIASWNAGEEGIVRYAVEVDAEGKALACEVSETSGFPALDSKTCELLMERAEFDPALEVEDTPIAGTFTSSYRWRKREPDMPQMSITFQYLHNEKGISSECEFLKMENLPERMRKDIERDRERGKTCPGPTGRQGVPYRDENGVPIAKRVTVTFDVQLEDPAQ